MTMLEMRTIFMVMMITAILCTFLLFLLWRQNRNRFSGIEFWSANLGFHSLAMSVLLFYTEIHDWVSAIIPNTIGITGLTLGYIGLESFLGKKNPRIYRYTPLTTFVLLQSYYFFIRPNVAIREFNFLFFWMLISFQCAWLMFRKADSSMRVFTKGVGISYFAFCILTMLRIVKNIIGMYIDYNYSLSGIFEKYVLIGHLLVYILLTYTLILMVNKRLLIDIKTSEEKFSKAFHSSPYAICLTNFSDGKIFEVNEGFENIFGYTSSELIGKTTLNLGIWNDKEERDKVIKKLLKGEIVHETELKLKKRSGELITGLLSLEFITVNNQKILLSSFSDITQRKIMEKKIKEISIRDPLTNIYNRRYIFDRLDSILTENIRGSREFSVSIIDLDHFKDINDSYGHQAGDYILMEFSKIMRQNIRPYDLFGRYGGEEFILVSPNMTKEQAAIKIEICLELIRNKEFIYNENKISYTFSCGISDSSEYDKETISVKKIIQKADERLYIAKNTGRNRVLPTVKVSPEKSSCELKYGTS